MKYATNAERIYGISGKYEILLSISKQIVGIN